MFSWDFIILEREKIKHMVGRYVDDFHRSYSRFQEFHTKNKKKFKILYFLGLIVPLAAQYGVVSFDRFTPKELVLLFLSTYLLENFIFVVSHVYVHVKMLKNYPRVSVPWAFYHHYVDSTLYGQYKETYRIMAINKVLTYINIVMVLLGCDNLIIFFINAIGFLDIVLHEYIHAGNYPYNSINPISGDFFLFGVLGKICSFIGIVDKKKHMLAHHKEDVHHQSKTKNWLDLTFPFPFSIIIEGYGDILFFLCKKTINNYAFIIIINLLFFLFVAKYISSSLISPEPEKTYAQYWILMYEVILWTYTRKVHSSCDSLLNRSQDISLAYDKDLSKLGK